MEAFIRIETPALPLRTPNINTDQIVPARFLRKQRSDGFGQYLFNDLRHDENGVPDPAFPMNDVRYAGAGIIVAGPNFGCGSSREMAVWAIADAGIRVIVAAQFADIFFSNCVRNGVLCVVLPEDKVEDLLHRFESTPGETLAVDLETQCVTTQAGEKITFAVDPFHKQCLLTGLDSIDYTLRYEDRITEFEKKMVES